MNQITKYIDGQLYCDVYECPQTKETLKFLEYIKRDLKDEWIDNKNYAIIYECKFCGKQWAKTMKNKDDNNPRWLPVWDNLKENPYSRY